MENCHIIDPVMTVAGWVCRCQVRHTQMYGAEFIFSSEINWWALAEKVLKQVQEFFRDEKFGQYSASCSNSKHNV